MSAPVKPWEKDFVGTTGSDQRIRLESSATLPTMMGPSRPVRVQHVPSVPARPWVSRSQPRLSSYGYGTSNPYMIGGYGHYGNYGGYGGYGSYGAYGGYRSYGANRYGVQGPEDPENRFIQLAEEATRPAFDSIQSVVDAFGSVSFMLESTYQAVVHTFRAVLGIAEHLGQLRSIFAALNVFRLVRWAYRKLCQVLGIKIAAAQESLWNDAAATADDVAAGLVGESSAPRWPIFVYFTIVVSGPLLMWRLLKSLSLGNAPASRSWDPKLEPASNFALVMYTFTAQTDKELNISAGKIVGFAPNHYQTNWSSGWALVSADRRTAGLVPLNYLQEVQNVPQSKKVAAPGQMTAPSAAATTNRETGTQQVSNMFPGGAGTNTLIGFPHDLSHPAVFNSSRATASMAASMSSKLDLAPSPSDELPRLAREKKPSAKHESERASETVGSKQKEESTLQSPTTDKSS